VQSFCTEFIIEIEHERRSLIHLRRSFSELKELQRAVSAKDQELLLSWRCFRTMSDLAESATLTLTLRDVVSDLPLPAHWQL
jgi:hypothetical protein